jgi:hypothetical protein
VERANLPKLYINPMSPEIISCVIEYIQNTGANIGFTVTRHQIDYNTGYVNDFRTAGFSNYVKNRLPNVMLCRDHLHGQQVYKTLLEDLKAGFSIIHIDPWFEYEMDNVVDMTALMISDRFECYYEVGTEQKVKEYDAETFDKFLVKLKDTIGEDLFERRIIYGVIQGKTRVFDGTNIAGFDKGVFRRMIDVCKKHGLLSKEHNCDFLGDGIKKRFEMGLDACNIGPELINIQNRIYINELKKLGRDRDIKKIKEICYRGGKWDRWTKSEDKIVETTMHYYYTDDEVEEIIRSLDVDVRSEIIKNIDRIYRFTV